MLYSISKDVSALLDMTKNTYWSAAYQKKSKNLSTFALLVAGVGFEPHDLRVMSPTSYRLLYPAILDCKYTDYFLICKFLLQKKLYFSTHFVRSK